MNNEIYNRLVKFISQEMSIDEKKLQPKANFSNDLGCDSLDIVEIVMKVEEEFNISIPDDSAEKIRTMEDLTNYIEGKIK